MTQLFLPTNTRGPWLVFPPSYDEAAAQARFADKFGVEPARVWEDDSNVFAGPAPRKEIEKL